MTAARSYDWRARAACLGADPQPFTVLDCDRQLRPETVAAATRYCRRCPSREDCAAAADAGQEIGLWAGVWRTRTDGKRPYRKVSALEVAAR